LLLFALVGCLIVLSIIFVFNCLIAYAAYLGPSVFDTLHNPSTTSNPTTTPPIPQLNNYSPTSTNSISTPIPPPSYTDITPIAPFIAGLTPQPPPAPIITIKPTYNPYDDDSLGDNDEDDQSADDDYSAAEVAALEKSGLWTDGDTIY
jgi:hypothetical protein